MSIFILIVDPLVLYVVMRSMKYTRRNAFFAGITAAQVSEFGFIVLFTGRQLGHLQGDEITIFTMVALATIFCSSYIITYNEQLYRFFMPFFRLFGKDQYRQIGKKVEEYDVWLFGYHRIGWKICEALAEKKIKFAVVDFNPAVINKLHKRNIRAFFGDASDIEFLHSLPLEKSELIISTIPESDDQKTLFQYVRNLSSKPIMIGNLYESMYLDDLYEAGADYVMMPHLLGGQWISEILRHHEWKKSNFKNLRKEQKEELKLRYTEGTH